MGIVDGPGHLYGAGDEAHFGFVMEENRTWATCAALVGKADMVE